MVPGPTPKEAEAERVEVEEVLLEEFDEVVLELELEEEDEPELEELAETLSSGSESMKWWIRSGALLIGLVSAFFTNEK